MPGSSVRQVDYRQAQGFIPAYGSAAECAIPVGFEPSSEIPSIPASAGLPAKPMAAVEAASRSRGGRAGSMNGPPPPPPPDAKEDPRAAAGKKVSYHDMDLVAEGDVELTY